MSELLHYHTFTPFELLEAPTGHNSAESQMEQLPDGQLPREEGANFTHRELPDQATRTLHVEVRKVSGAWSSNFSELPAEHSMCKFPA